LTFLKTTAAPWCVVKLRFGEFELETGARRLMRGDAEVHLTPKAFELLATLVERRPNALSKARGEVDTRTSEPR
jgi:DNA-binding response OmpR family regulator